MGRLVPIAITLAALGGIATMAISKAAAQEGRNVYVITHVDVIGSGGNLPEAVRLVSEFVAESRQDAGVIRFEAFQQEGHPNHFTIYEVWQNRGAFDAHLAAEHAKRFRQALQPMLGSPFRERLHYLVR